MNAIVPIRANVPNTHDGKTLALIRRTVAADTSDDEFNLFIHMARALKLDPLRRQVYALVYNKNKPDKRRMSLIVGIDGFRSIADRTGNYRPDDDEPSFEYDPALKSVTNPAGLVKATVRVYKFAHGEWHRVTASAHWEEYVPLKDEWAENESGKSVRTGKQILDSSSNWYKMPRVMLPKVAEALALRKAWPDDFSNVYAEEEIDRSRTIDLSPTELAHQGSVEERQQKIGAPGISVVWEDGKPLESVPIGQFADRVTDFIKQNVEEPSAIAVFRERNHHALREFWTHSPSDALELRKTFEAHGVPT